MAKIPVNQLRVNTYFTAPLFLDDRYIILYPNLPVTTDLLNRLNQWNYREVTTTGRVSETIPSLKMNPLIEVINDKKNSVISREEKDMEELEATLSRVYENCRLTQKIEWNASFEFAKKFRNVIHERLNEFLSLPINPHSRSDYLISQSTRTAVLAHAIGESLKIPLYRQLELIAAALLHKIGMIKIPKEIYLKNSALTDKELELIHYYPVLGARLLKSNGFSHEIVQGVLEHQESYDGSGYPQKMEGEDICLFGRILHISSSYCAMTALRPYKFNRTNESNSVIEILQKANRKYDPVICRILVQILSIFPVGTMVLMKNSSTGVVVKPNPNDPRSPFVKLLTDPNMKPMMSERIVDTRSRDFVIIRTLNDNEISSIKSLFTNKP